MVYQKECIVCRDHFTTIDADRTCCSSDCGLICGRNKKKFYICQQCGKPFWRPNAYRMKYCSKECDMLARHIAAQKREKLRAPKEKIIYTRICPMCGVGFNTPYHNKICCSPACRHELNNQQHREHWKEEYVPRTFICRECGCAVNTECGHTNSDFCSQECAEKYHDRAYKIRRNEQMKSAYRAKVSFKQIYNRDHGICRICGLPIPYDKSPEKLWSATIDHIVPLSRGGTHESQNCQLAHRLCNSIKAADESNFNIDWKQKNNIEEGRWSEALSELYSIILSLQKGA